MASNSPSASALCLFQTLCKAAPLDFIPELRSRVDTTLEKVRLKATEYSFGDFSLVEELSQCCHSLLDLYQNYGEGERALIVGAVRYFALHGDSKSDDPARQGFDDDRDILNYVLERLGINGMRVG